MSTTGSVRALRPAPLSWLSALFLVAGAALILVFQSGYRSVETVVSGLTVSLLGGTRTWAAAGKQTLYFGLDTHHPLGLRITEECTSALLLLPLLLVAGLLVVLRKQLSTRILLAVAAAALFVVLLNQFRIVVLVWMIESLGASSGYYWGHTLWGSVISIVGGALGLGLFIWLAVRRGRHSTGERA